MMCEILEKRILSLAFLLGSMSAVCAKFMSFAVGFGDSLASGSKELWRCQNLSFWVGFLAFLWLQVAKKHGVPKIHVFLVLKFCSVGELSCWGCELEIECQIVYPSVTGKVQTLPKVNLFWSILACVVHTLSKSKCFCVLGAGQKAHFYLVFYVKFGDIRIPSLSQEKR